MVKHVPGHCAVGIVMVQRKQRVSGRCPRCGGANEDVPHVITCTSTDASNTWNDALNDLMLCLQSRGTNPTFSQTIIADLRSRRRGLSDLNPSDTRWDGISLRSQNRIGWFNFLQGRVSIGWAYHQQSYFKDHDMRRTGQRWVESLIKKLWDVSWTMWDHRNGALHESDDHGVLGNLILQDMIRRKYARGQRGLPSLPDISSRHSSTGRSN